MEVRLGTRFWSTVVINSFDDTWNVSSSQRTLLLNSQRCRGLNNLLELTTPLSDLFLRLRNLGEVIVTSQKVQAG